jgi:hypothetical protein
VSATVLEGGLGHAVEMSQADVKNLGLEQCDEVEVTSGGRSTLGRRVSQTGSRPE